jgi:hypothetical protein
LEVARFNMANINELPSVAEPQQSLPSVQGSVPLVPQSQVFNGQASTGITIEPAVGGFFNVRGYATKPFRENFKKLGGRWNMLHHVWSFEVANLQYVKDLVDGILKGTVTPDPIVERPKGGNRPNNQSTGNNTGVQSLPGLGQKQELNLPTIGVSDRFQTVSWKIFVPLPGMQAKVQVDKVTGVYTVVSVNGSRNEGYTTIVTNSSRTENTQLEVANGHWQVRGYAPKHSIRFDNA